MEFKTNGNPWINGYPIHECYSLLEQKAFHLLSIVNASEKSNALIDLKQIDYSAQIEPLIPRQTEPLVLREKNEKFSV